MCRECLSKDRKIAALEEMLAEVEKVRDLARASSNRNLEAKRLAEAEVARLRKDLFIRLEAVVDRFSEQDAGGSALLDTGGNDWLDEFEVEVETGCTYREVYSPTDRDYERLTQSSDTALADRLDIMLVLSNDHICTRQTLREIKAIRLEQAFR